MANKLHELLAVEQDRKHKAVQAMGETIKVFSKQDPLFDGMLKRYISLEEDAEQIPNESKEMVSTVKERLTATLETVIAAIDAVISKEETNASGVAKSELIVGQKSMGVFSATSLLSLESHLLKVKELYQQIPVLDSAKKWGFDTQKGVYSTEEEVKFRSVKRPKVVVKYAATKEHPAQTELLNIDFQIGKYETVYTSGKITAVNKANLLKRIDEIIEAVKIARSKANNVEVNNTKIADKLFSYINDGIF